MAVKHFTQACRYSPFAFSAEKNDGDHGGEFEVFTRPCVYVGIVVEMAQNLNYIKKQLTYSGESFFTNRADVNTGRSGETQTF